MTEPFIPTHTCFDDALELAFSYGQGMGELEVLIVHARCTGYSTGTAFAHGWVEAFDGTQWLAWQTAYHCKQRVHYALPREEMRRLWQVECATTFTLLESLEAVRQCDHAGPWVPELHALCAADQNAGQIVGYMQCVKPVMVIRAHKAPWLAAAHGRKA